jgi:hypothetical protein
MHFMPNKKVKDSTAEPSGKLEGGTLRDDELGGGKWRGGVDSQEFILTLQKQVQQQIQLERKQLLPASLNPHLSPLLRLIAHHPWQFLLVFSGVQALLVELITY